MELRDTHFLRTFSTWFEADVKGKIIQTETKLGLVLSVSQLWKTEK